MELQHYLISVFNISEINSLISGIDKRSNRVWSRVIIKRWQNNFCHIVTLLKILEAMINNTRNRINFQV